MNGEKNLWGDTLMFFEPESEHSAAAVCEGFAVAGGRVTNFTSGQGLVLMKEVLYTISGKRLPVVMNIGARALTSQGLNVHAGHDDVMSVADCGWGMLFARNAQEAGDFCLIARRAAEATQTPFFNVQDGFLTTHTVETVRLHEPEFMKEYIGDPKEKLTNLMDPANPMMSGVVQNQDSYMKGKIAQRWYYDRVAPALEDAFEEFGRKTGRQYGNVEAYRCEDADYILVGMGCYMETAKVTVDYLREKKGIKAGCLTVFVFRPFPAQAHRRGAEGLPGVHRLRADGRPALDDRQPPDARDQGGVLRRGDRAERPGEDRPRAAHLPRRGRPRQPRRAARRHHRRVPQHDDRRPGLLLRRHRPPAGAEARATTRTCGRRAASRCAATRSAASASVTTNKVIATIAGNVFGKDVQAYPKYGSEKKGLPTTYYLTIADTHINMHCELEQVELLCINDPTAILSPLTLQGPGAGRGDLHAVAVRRPGRRVEAHPATRTSKTIRDKKIRVYYCDMVRIAREVASEPDLQMRMQGIVLLGAFLKLTPYAKEAEMSDEQVYAGVEKALRKYFGKRGDQVVQDNLTCIKRGYGEMKEIPRRDRRRVAATRAECEHRARPLRERHTALERMPFIAQDTAHLPESPDHDCDLSRPTPRR